jgi:hypothetical protein
MDWHFVIFTDVQDCLRTVTAAVHSFTRYQASDLQQNDARTAVS